MNPAYLISINGQNTKSSTTKNLSFNNKVYSLQISLTEGEIILNIQEKFVLEYYQLKLSNQEFLKISKYFRLFDNLNEIYEDFINKDINVKDINTKKDEITLFINIAINNNKKEIIFVLNKKYIDKNKDIDIILSNYNLLKKEYDELLEKYKKLLPPPCNSLILKSSNKSEEFISQILEWCDCKKMELIFRGTRDGMNAKSFHEKCDNKGETITLYQNDKKNIFGGYASISWTNNSGNYFSAPGSFIFTLANIYNTQPTKFPNKNDGKEVCHNKDYGPLFGNGCDILISSDFVNGDNYSTFPSSYSDILGKGRSIFTGDVNNNNKKIKFIEVEVFKLFK